MESRRVRRTIKQLGDDIRTARIRRKWSQKDLATRMNVSLGTVKRMESGEVGVGIGTIATAFLCFGVIERIGDLIAPQSDLLCVASDRFNLPKRVRSSLRQNQESDEQIPYRETEQGFMSF